VDTEMADVPPADVAQTAETAAPAEAQPPAVAVDPRRQWYVVHTYSGYENKVKTNLEKRVTSMSMEDKIFRIMVPEEEQIELTKEGKRKTVKRKIYPGYVLVEMELTDDSWYVVRNTPGVTGFVSSGNRPTPLRPEEVQGILEQMGMAQERPRPKLDVEVGQNIRVRSGAFDGFIGVVDEIDEARGKLRVLISMFGRETPLELEFNQVEKL
jgi:transcriptional antiterminator NusG